MITQARITILNKKSAPPHSVTFSPLLNDSFHLSDTQSKLSSPTKRKGKYSIRPSLRKERKTREICLKLQPRNLTTPGSHPPRRAPSPSSRAGLSPRRLLNSTTTSSRRDSHSLIYPRCLDARPTTTNTTALASPASLRNRLLKRKTGRTMVASRPIMRDKRASLGRIRSVWHMPS